MFSGAPSVSLPPSGYGVEVDVWSVGIVLYILLSGGHPFQPPPRERNDTGFMKAILRGKLSFSGSEWKGVSEGAKEVVGGMLQHDPKLRWTASQVSNHPWIQNAPEEPLAKGTLERFQTFFELVRMKKYKKEAVKVISRGLSPDQIFSALRHPGSVGGQRPLRTLLALVGECGNADVSKALVEAARPLGVLLDTLINISEVLTASHQLCQIEMQESLFNTFSLFDEDLSGYISKLELEKSCRKYNLSPRTVHDLSIEVNRDELGRLDYNEFVAMMRKEAGGVSRREVERSLEDGSFSSDVFEEEMEEGE